MWLSVLVSLRLLVCVVYLSICILLVFGRFFFYVLVYFRNNVLNLNRDFIYFYKMYIIVVVLWSFNFIILWLVKNNLLLIYGIKLN